ncbi:acetyltransferase [Echinicola jeungdonensis]|uniref:acetyltransferase n=1 Tax=Echinicola jeungdonensis TaxID=709343 RepID=UPI0025B4EA85|nr:acetyltransferase [Echinicola jeungdonensis]MDN3670051.1 acetyltransferase [Echinicola jeungdonensis]
MYIMGASGHAKAVIAAVESKGIEINGVLDDNPEIKECLKYPVSTPENFDIAPKSQMLVAIGDNKIREKVVLKLGKKVFYSKVAHSFSWVSEYSNFGEGTVIMAGAIVQPHTEIGKHVIVNTAAVVDHDCLIGDFSHIAPHATLCGGVIVGIGSLIGAGCTVLPGIKIGENCVVGAGATVLRDVLDGEIVYGS